MTTKQKGAGVMGADVRRLKRLCGRCEERVTSGEKSVVAEFAPYVGLRMHLRCMKAVVEEEVPEEPTP